MAGPIDEALRLIERRIARKVAKGEREIVRRFALLLGELRGMLGAIYQQYEQDGIVTFDEMAKFDRLQRLFRDVDFLLSRSYRELQQIIYDVVGWSYAESYDLTAWSIEQESRVAQIAASSEQIGAAVSMPIDKLTLAARLEQNRKLIVAKIRQEITLGLVKGETYGTMMDRIKPALEGDATKAMRVVRTEAHRVQEGGKVEAVQYADKQGVRMMKTWRTSKDERVRRRPKDTTDHKMLEGVKLPVSENFVGVKGKGLAPGMLGHPAEDINCRCFLQYTIDRVEKMPYTSIETATFDKWRQEKRVA